VTDVVADYAQPSFETQSRWDEMVDPDHGVRDTWRDLGSALRLLGPDGLSAQRRSVASLLAEGGVTYRPRGATQEQAWSLDPVPMLIGEAEWGRLEPGLAQRAELLDCVLTDLYGPRRLLADRLLPPEIVYAHDGFLRAADQIRHRGERQLFSIAADLVRAPDGQWVVLTDRAQAPSGTGYTMANRRVISRSLPDLYRDTRIHRIGPFFQAMRVALQSLAPNHGELPRIVLLTSGASSETAFDQAFLSSLLGFPLVEGADLVARDGHIWQRSIGRLEAVDVIVRRVDAAFCDPLELRPDSQLGVPGLVEANRLGNVAVVNGLGSGVLENPALYPFLPRLSRILLDQPLNLPSVQTWWCGEESARKHVLANLESLVVKPIARRIVSGSRYGGELSSGEREELARRIEANPHGWVGQSLVSPSTTPGVGPAGLEACPVVLRTFAFADGASYRVLPGGLGRVSPDVSSRFVATSDGALAKDVWVLSSTPSAFDESRPSDGAHGQLVAAVSPRVAESLFWLGRYAERAEDVSRLVAVADNRWHDIHPGVDPAIPQCVDVLIDALLAITATRPGGRTIADSPHDLLHVVIAGDGGPGTLAHDIRRIRELASASRDQLSTDTWAILRGLERALRPFHARLGGDVATAMTTLRESLMAFAGLAAESMVRDSGWLFMDAGRRVERALQIARLLRGALVSSISPEVDALTEESTLIAAESIITHRRRYSARSGAATVLELLLIDRDNPRSLAFQLDRLALDLRRIGSPGEVEQTLEDRALRISARLLAVDCQALALTDPAGSRGDLDLLLASIVDELHELAAAVDTTHFAGPSQLRQLSPIVDFSTLESV